MRRQVVSTTSSLRNSKTLPESDSDSDSDSDLESDSLYRLTKIISNGQDGVSIAALKAAKNCGFETGGCIPFGFATKSGNKPELEILYNLVPLNFVTNHLFSVMSMYKKNIDESEAVLVFRFSTEMEIDHSICYAQNKKWLRIKLPEVSFYTLEGYRPTLVISELSLETIEVVKEFLTIYNPTTLNIFGSFEKEYEVQTFLEAIFKNSIIN